MASRQAASVNTCDFISCRVRLAVGNSDRIFERCTDNDSAVIGGAAFGFEQLNTAEIWGFALVDTVGTFQHDVGWVRELRN